ncbi:MAG: WXG100 family type VII secretion target [Nocardioides sp.]
MDIDHDGIVRIGERINFAQSEFTKKANDLEANLGHMATSLQGEAGTAFHKLMIEWQSRQKKITTLLQQFEDSLTTTQKTSTEQDSTQAANMFALNKNLNQ